MTRISFIVKVSCNSVCMLNSPMFVVVLQNPDLPANFNFEDKPFQIPSDIDHTFQLAVEVFDMQSSLLHLYAAVLTNLDPSKGVSAQQIQCQLAPLIPAIQDSAALYDVIFKLMKALHSCEYMEIMSTLSLYLLCYFVLYSIACRYTSRP